MEFLAVACFSLSDFIVVDYLLSMQLAALCTSLRNN